MSQPKPWAMNQYGRVFDASREPVVLSGFSLSCGYTPDGCSPKQNDAEVVRAVNCHADLLAACELLLSGPTEEAVIAAKSAVKKARGE